MKNNIMKLCECGCGQVTNKAKSSRPDRGIKKGDYYRYIAGHHPHGFKKGHRVNNDRVLTKEHKKKISNGLINSECKAGCPIGTVAWNKGMSKANGDPLTYGRPRSEETKRKISEATTGLSKSEEHKKKLSIAATGKIPTKEAREKMSVALRKRWSDPEYKKTACKFEKGNVPWNKGKKDCYTEEMIKNMLRRRTPSSLEEKFQDIIDKNDLPYKFVGDGSFMIGRKNPDFININGSKIAIEVYARYYKLKHSETIDEWKEDRRKIFNDYGWEIIFFDETEVNEENVLKNIRG